MLKRVTGFVLRSPELLDNSLVSLLGCKVVVYSNLPKATRGIMSQLTERQREIKDRLDEGMQARDIAAELGITRNAVYQQIQRMRNNGDLARNYTPTGQPVREQRPGMEALAKLVGDMDGDSDESRNAGALALVQELRRTRDDLDAIAQRISTIIPR